MYAYVKELSAVHFVVFLGLGLLFAINVRETSASESSATTSGQTPLVESTSPIELEPSLESHCRQTTPDQRIQYEECASAKRMLALMNAERRDKVWAAKMESDLRGWVESLGLQGFILRSVKCRLSWCIVEVVSTERNILEMNLRDESKKKLFDSLDLFAPDLGDPNAQDQAIIYKRYCSSQSEVLDANGRMVQNLAAVGQKC